MSDTTKRGSKEELAAFVKEFNLDPANNEAIINCLFFLAKR
jgi:hypothetical protein